VRRGVASSDAARSGRIIPLGASAVGAGVAMAAGNTRLHWNSESMGNPEW